MLGGGTVILGKVFDGGILVFALEFKGRVGRGFPKLVDGRMLGGGKLRFGGGRVKFGGAASEALVRLIAGGIFIAILGTAPGTKFGTVPCGTGGGRFKLGSPALGGGVVNGPGARGGGRLNIGGGTERLTGGKLEVAGMGDFLEFLVGEEVPGGCEVDKLV